MPTIQYVNNEIHFADVMAVMLFPGADEEPGRRAHAQAILQAYFNILSQKARELEADGADSAGSHPLAAVASWEPARETFDAMAARGGPPVSDSIVLRQDGRSRDGFIAGKIIDLMLRCRKHAPEWASVNQVKAATALCVKSLGILSCSRSTVRDAWTSHRRVAHLWAAYNSLSLVKDVAKESRLDLLLLLFHSEWYLRLAAREEIPAHGEQGQHLLLDPAQVWRPPAEELDRLTPLLDEFLSESPPELELDAHDRLFFERANA